MSRRQSGLHESDCLLDQAARSFFEKHCIRSSDGYEHAKAVANHSRHVMEEVSSILSMSCREQNEVFAASLLHGVDNRRYFPTHTELESHIILPGTTYSAMSVDNPNYAHTNMREIIRSSAYGGCTSYFDYLNCVSNVAKMIDLVDTSTITAAASSSVGDATMLIPRYCNQLELIGKSGVRRCFQEYKSSGTPLYDGRDSDLDGDDGKREAKAILSTIPKPASSDTAAHSVTPPSFLGQLRNTLKTASLPSLKFRTADGGEHESKYLTEQFDSRRREMEVFVAWFTDLCKKINGGRYDWFNVPITEKDRILIETFCTGASI